MTGVYAIVNRYSGRVYIGQAKNLKTRWSSHLHQLRNIRHFNKELQQDYNLLGEKAFEFTVLYTGTNVNEVERNWIIYFGGVKSKLNYNRSKGRKK